ncbi:hypothetical protein [Haloactinomyces albus]|uniref:Transcriptional regulator n=1 Tax=Haloactinomyces albus TaxID=1352928 RepID=A0AAE3ZET7_9ACTN|nr:hypothetical protein [Haloactinomyces albus]MDR7303633.1 putative transcriptional regulator [Haloactinomyces albus]
MINSPIRAVTYRCVKGTGVDNPGLEAVTMREIAAEARVANGALRRLRHEIMPMDDERVDEARTA